MALSDSSALPSVSITSTSLQIPIKKRAESIDMGVKAHQNRTSSTKPEVGEIDTRAPFESVKAAVSLFGEGTGSAEKPTIKKAKPLHVESVLAKETRLQLVQKELNKLKEQLKNAENTKNHALGELEKAKKTAAELTQKLQLVTESKELAINATENAKNQAKQLENERSVTLSENDYVSKHELEIARERYTTAVTELDAAKQELRKLRQEFEASSVAKVAAFQEAEDAEHVTKGHKERASELSKEIASVQESITNLKLAHLQAQEEQANILSDKDSRRQFSKVALEETQKKLEHLNKEYNPDVALNLEKMLDAVNAEIDSLQKEVENAKLADLEFIKSVNAELDGAKESLLKVMEEETSLGSLVESIKQETESVKKEHSELKERESEAENNAGNLHVKLQKTRAELEGAIAEESKTKKESEEYEANIRQLSLDSENARMEAEKLKKDLEELMKEANVSHIALIEAEKNLHSALKEAENAKSAESKAVEQIRIISERTNAARSSTTDITGQITLSKEEYETLNRKVEESNTLAEVKIAAALAQVEAVKASEYEALKRIEVTRKEIEDMDAATKEALKRADMAEAAKQAVEGELRRWREREQKKAAEAASRILEEMNASAQASPSRVEKINRLDNHGGGKKGEKMPATKKALLPNLSGIFQRKKSRLDIGSPSYLPGEEPL